MESSNENNGDPSGEVENIASEITPPFPSDRSTFSLRDIYDKYENLSREHASLAAGQAVYIKIVSVCIVLLSSGFVGFATWVVFGERDKFNQRLDGFLTANSKEIVEEYKQKLEDTVSQAELSVEAVNQIKGQVEADKTVIDQIKTDYEPLIQELRYKTNSVKSMSTEENVEIIRLSQDHVFIDLWKVFDNKTNGEKKEPLMRFRNNEGWGGFSLIIEVSQVYYYTGYERYLYVNDRRNYNDDPRDDPRSKGDPKDRPENANDDPETLKNKRKIYYEKVKIYDEKRRSLIPLGEVKIYDEALRSLIPLEKSETTPRSMRCELEFASREIPLEPGLGSETNTNLYQKDFKLTLKKRHDVCMVRVRGTISVVGAYKRLRQKGGDWDANYPGAIFDAWSW